VASRVGLQSVDLTPRLATERRLGLQEGAVLTAVEPDSPAQQAGLRVDDVVVQFNRRPVRTATDLRNRLALVPVGSSAELLVARGADRITVAVAVAPVRLQTAAARTAPKGGAPGTPDAAGWGLKLAPAEGQALTVLDVDPAGRAHAAGLRAGDLVVGVNRQPTGSPEALYKALEAPGERVVSLLRGEAKLRIVIR
jgi:S1-C subfamily serine protease